MKAPWTEVSISRVLGKIFPFSVNDFSYITGPRTAKAKYILIEYIKIVIVCPEIMEKSSNENALNWRYDILYWIQRYLPNLSVIKVKWLPIYRDVR